MFRCNSNYYCEPSKENNDCFYKDNRCCGYCDKRWSCTANVKCECDCDYGDGITPVWEVQ